MWFGMLGKNQTTNWYRVYPNIFYDLESLNIHACNVENYSEDMSLFNIILKETNMQLRWYIKVKAQKEKKHSHK